MKRNLLIAGLALAIAALATWNVADPSFSNAKRMREAFDIKRDHGALLRGAADLLAPGG